MAERNEPKKGNPGEDGIDYEEKEFDPDKTDRMPEDRHIQVIFENDKEGSETEGGKKE